MTGPLFHILQLSCTYLPLVISTTIGQGVYQWLDGSVFKGTFVDGLPEGSGTMTWSDGSRYTDSPCDKQHMSSVCFLLFCVLFEDM